MYQLLPLFSPWKLNFSIFFFVLSDFSNISEDGGIYIKDIIHKAVIEVNELGSKAAAVTAIGFETFSLHNVKNKWIFDRPFLYAIMDKKHNFPLFVGRVVDPSNKNELGSRNKNTVGQFPPIATQPMPQSDTRPVTQGETQPAFQGVTQPSNRPLNQQVNQPINRPTVRPMIHHMTGQAKDKINSNE